MTQVQNRGLNKYSRNILMKFLKIIYYICISFVVMISLVFFVSIFLLLKNE